MKEESNTMTLEFSYPAKFEKDEAGRILVTFPDFPRAATDGANAIEATEEAIDCLGSVIALAMAEKGPVPHPSRAKRRQRMLPVPLWIAPKLALYWRMQEKGVTNSELARRLGVRETVVRRMLDPDHATKSQKLQAALEALGQMVVMVTQDAA
jgi:antitoxin HicB